jgi:hypothetical protein
MYVAKGNAGVELREPEDCGRFSVSTDAADGLAAAGAGYVADGAGFVRVDWLRDQAAGRVGDDWPDRFEKMLAFAATRGWLTADGSHVRGHLE